MKNTVKLFSTDKKTLGRLITLPIVGDTQFNSEDNSVEIDEEKVEDLLKLDFGIKFISEKEQTALNKKKKQQEENKEKNKEEKEKIMIMLKALSTEELEEVAKEYPIEETNKIRTKTGLINFLCNEMLMK